MDRRTEPARNDRVEHRFTSRNQSIQAPFWGSPRWRANRVRAEQRITASGSPSEEPAWVRRK